MKKWIVLLTENDLKNDKLLLLNNCIAPAEAQLLVLRSTDYIYVLNERLIFGAEDERFLSSTISRSIPIEDLLCIVNEIKPPLSQGRKRFIQSLMMAGVSVINGDISQWINSVQDPCLLPQLRQAFPKSMIFHKNFEHLDANKDWIESTFSQIEHEFESFNLVIKSEKGIYRIKNAKALYDLLSDFSSRKQPVGSWFVVQRYIQPPSEVMTAYSYAVTVQNGDIVSIMAESYDWSTPPRGVYLPNYLKAYDRLSKSADQAATTSLERAILSEKALALVNAMPHAPHLITMNFKLSRSTSLLPQQETPEFTLVGLTTSILKIFEDLPPDTIKHSVEKWHRSMQAQFTAPIEMSKL